MQRAMDETARRRTKQQAWNLENNITPVSISSGIRDVTGEYSGTETTGQTGHHLAAAEDQAGYVTDADVPVGANLAVVLADLEKRMFEHAENLEFEEAARMRDEIKRLSEPGAE